MASATPGSCRLCGEPSSSQWYPYASDWSASVSLCGNCVSRFEPVEGDLEAVENEDERLITAKFEIWREEDGPRAIFVDAAFAKTHFGSVTYTSGPTGG